MCDTDYSALQQAQVQRQGGAGHEKSTPHAANTPLSDRIPAMEKRDLRAWLLEELLTHESVPCPSCRADLRGTQGTNCPKCRQALALRVGTPSSEQGLDLLVEHLSRNEAQCPGCGYDLRGLTAAACPECNRALRLSVGLVDPQLGAFVFGAVGLGMSLGFSLLLLVYFIFMLLTQPLGGNPPMMGAVILFLGTVVSGLGLSAWLFGRRRWLGRLQPASRWAWAAAVAIIGLICPIVFMATIR